MFIVCIFILIVGKVYQCTEIEPSPLKMFLDLFQTFPQGSPAGGTLGTSDMLNRTQSQIQRSYAFPCTQTRGGNYFKKPEFVRNVGPADIDVVAALGDYLVSGSGALANTTIDTFKDSPEVSFAIGGKGDWRSFTTIPNILKEFNPNVIGFSVGRYKDKGFNFAKSDALSSGLVQQARELVSALENDPRINMNINWKLITLSTGQTDLCTLSCTQPGSGVQFVENVMRAVDMLFVLPNVIINVVSPLDPSLIQSALHRPLSCQLLTRHLCPCVTSGEAKPRSQFLSDLSGYRQGLARLIKSGRYGGRSNAAVLLQTGLEYLRLPQDKGLSLRLLGLPDVSLLPDLAFLAPDCFHPSQKLHAHMAKAIWNNMFESQDNKLPAEDVRHVRCPSNDNPYFAIDNESAVNRMSLARVTREDNHININYGQ